MVTARMELSNYTNKVLNVIKAKYELKDKSAALNKFIEIFGEDIVEREVKPEYLKKVLTIHKDHVEQFPNRKMTIAELDKLCGV